MGTENELSIPRSRNRPSPSSQNWVALANSEKLTKHNIAWQTNTSQEDVEELLVLARVDEDVDGAVDHEGKVVDVDQRLDPVGPVLQVSVHGHLQYRADDQIATLILTS